MPPTRIASDYWSNLQPNSSPQHVIEQPAKSCLGLNLGKRPSNVFDFNNTIGSDGVCRLNPEVARHVAQIVCKALHYCNWWELLSGR